jgi:hypothetical protein
MTPTRPKTGDQQGEERSATEPLVRESTGHRQLQTESTCCPPSAVPMTLPSKVAE